MDFDDIERILELVREHDLAEFELEREGLKIRVRKNLTGVAHDVQTGLTPAPQPAPLPPGPVRHQPPPVAAAPPAAAALEGDDTVELAVVKSPIVGTFYRSLRARRSAVRGHRRSGQEGPGALHHRGDEADERDHFGIRRGNRERLRRERQAGPIRRAAVRDQDRLSRHVQENPDRQPRRNRPPGDLRLSRARDQDRGGLFRGRRKLPARAVRRRGRLHRPGAQRRQLSERAGGDQRRGDHRRRRDPSRLRIPLGERLPRRGLRGLPHQVHRPDAERDPAARRQGAGAAGHEEGRRADPAGQRRPGRQRGQGARRSRATSATR